MAEKDLLKDKRILIVDDEPDVLETLRNLLFMCDVVPATNFEQAKNLMEGGTFDIVILDIMGVEGYRLLDVANQKHIPAVMLTAHALSPEDTAKSFKKGAASYVPKEKMADITIFLNDILEAKQKKKSTWWRWLARFASYYDETFGPDWKDKDKEFWDKLRYYM
jgi:DNA-binding response OmpR family regulator